MMNHDDSLDDLFRIARETPPEPGSDFMARVLKDALAQQPVVPMRRAAPRGIWTRIAAALGGAVAIAGISTAAMAGLVIGFVQPEPVMTLAGTFGLSTSESLELLPGFEGLLTEDLTQ